MASASGADFATYDQLHFRSLRGPFQGHGGGAPEAAFARFRKTLPWVTASKRPLRGPFQSHGGGAPEAAFARFRKTLGGSTPEVVFAVLLGL